MSRLPTVIERAQADLAAGEPWRARDRLTGSFANDRRNLAVAEMLGEVYARMGDLPAAGRWWYLSAVDDDRHNRARDAYEARHGHRPDEIRSQLPRIEAMPMAPQVRARLEAVGWTAAKPTSDPEPEPAPDTLLHRAGWWAGGMLFAALTVGVWLAGAVWLVRAVL